MMIIAHFCEVLFLILPPLLLAIRWKRKSLAPWWLIALALTLGGWALVNIRHQFFYAALEERMRTYEADGVTPPPDFVYTYIADGGPKAIALFLGWLLGPLWSLPWLAVYAAINIVRKKEPNQAAQTRSLARPV